MTALIHSHFSPSSPGLTVMTASALPIYLASKSPRRSELLRQIGVRFDLLLLRGDGSRAIDVSELVHPGEAAQPYVARVAQEKADFAWQVMQWRSLAPRPVLAADTSVVIDGIILGKPADAVEATAMLQLLSGRTHQVLTALALRHGALPEQIEQTMQVSEVSFGVLSQQMIAAYCKTQEPYDKAGGYGIQGIAACFIERIAGSHSGIMGLPLFETAQLLRRAGIPTL
jgi:septum formation protein